MDDAIDEMQDDGARRSTSTSSTSFTPEMKQMVAMIAEAAALTAEAMPLLRDISRNGARIHELTEKARRASKAKPTRSTPPASRRRSRNMPDKPMQFIVAREIYKHLERITDAFEDVANEIDGIVIDHA